MSGSKKVFTTLGSSNHVPEEREAFDYYATDPRAVEMLLELEQFSPVIWEPACGEGHISKVLQAHCNADLEKCHPLDRGFLTDRRNEAIAKHTGTMEAREIVAGLKNNLERLTGWHD